MLTLKKITVATTLAVSASFAQVSMAEGAAGSGPNPFTDCGIGGALFKNVGWAAATSNIIWDVGTTAITSATASPETCNAKDVQAATFILETYENLAEETARGEGDHLAALLNIVEVAEDSREAVVAALRSQMADIVSAEDYASQDIKVKANAFYASLKQAVKAA